MTVYDPAGTAAWERVVNAHAANGALPEQLLVGRDGTITTTAWDNTGTAAWSLTQTVTAANGLLVTDATALQDPAVVTT